MKRTQLIWSTFDLCCETMSQHVSFRSFQNLSCAMCGTSIAGQPKRTSDRGRTLESSSTRIPLRLPLPGAFGLPRTAHVHSGSELEAGDCLLCQARLSTFFYGIAEYVCCIASFLKNSFFSYVLCFSIGSFPLF